jgi:hypothetical protein
MRQWSDLVEFEVVPVVSSADAARRFGPAEEWPREPVGAQVSESAPMRTIP